MSFFAVELDELHQLRSQLQSCTEDMRQVAGQLTGASAGQLGTPGLDSACVDFGDAWGHGIDKMAAGADRIGEGVRRACEAYAGTEQALARMYAQALTGGGGDGSGGGH